MTKDLINVLVVDDSAIAREILISVLQRDPGFHIMGTAEDGQQAVRLACELQPDVVVMDLGMPVLDGLNATGAIMAACPCPILLVTGVSARREGPAVFEALSLGALDVIAKPEFSDSDGSATAFNRKVRALANVKSLQVGQQKKPRSVPPTGPHGTTPTVTSDAHFVRRVVAIAASTGGPSAVLAMLRSVRKGLPAAWVLVQHIADGFHQDLATHLARCQTLEIVVGQEGQQLKAGQLILAPGGTHMVVTSRGRIAFSDRAPIKHQRPSGSLLLNSVAEAYGTRAIGVVMTGMGDDGADGIAAIKKAGGTTIAQDEATSTIFGMPRVAIERKVVDHVLPLHHIGERISRMIATETGDNGAGKEPIGGAG